MSKHTPTPWKVDENTQLPLAIIQDNENGYGVLEIGTHYEDTPEQARTDAEFIVKAVNCHDELVEAIINHLNPLYDRQEAHTELLRVIDKATREEVL